MRGISLANLIPSPVTRGFYVTRSENDSSSSTTMDDFVSFYTTTENPVEQQMETTLIPDISTTNEIFTVARNDQNESKFDTRNNDAKNIVTDEAATIIYNDRDELGFDIPNDIINNKNIDIHKEKFSILSSSEDSGSAENLSDYEEPDAIAISVSRPASKRGKSLRNFDYNTTPFPNAHVISPTSPTRRKIALAVSRYNEITTPLWTGKRIVRKRIRTTVSPIKNTIRQMETDTIRSTANAFKSASATSTISSTFTSARREPPTTSMIPTIPRIALESTIPSEILNIRRNHENSINKNIEDPKSHTTAEAAVTLTSSVIPATPLISKITLTTSNPTVDIISTIPYDSTSTTIRASTDASVITTTLSTVAVAKAPAVATDATIMTTSAIMSDEIEINSVTANYSTTAIPTITNTNVIATDSTIATDSAITTAPATANTEVETASIIEYSTAAIPAITNTNIIATESAIATDFTITTAPAIANIEVETASIIENSTAAIPAITNTNIIATESAIATDFTITTVPATANIEVETASIIENSTVAIPAITNTQTIATDPAITTTYADANTGIETTFTMTNYSAVTIPETANTHEVVTDVADTSTQQITSIETDTISTIANYSVDAIPITMYAHDDVTDSAITTISAAKNTEAETTSTIANYSRFDIPATTNTRATTTIPATTVSPLITIILPTANTHTDATAPVTASNLVDADADTVTTNMITTTTPATVIPMTIDPNLITTSANVDTSSTITSAIIETLAIITQPRISSVTSSKDPIISTYTASISSVAPTTLTTESSTIYFANTSILDISSNSDTLAVTETVKSTQSIEIPTIFETSPVINSTTAAISKSLLSTNSGTSSAATTAFSTQTDESSFTPINTQTPSILSIITPITDTATVASEKSAVFSTLPAISRKSIVTNAIIRTTTNAYESSSVRTSEESTMPDLKIDFEKAISRVIQRRTKYRTTTSTYEPSSAQTTNEEFTMPDLKIDSKEANPKAIRSRTRYRTTTSTYEPSSAQTTNEEFTTPDLKIDSKEANSKAIRSRTRYRTTTNTYEPNSAQTTNKESTTPEIKTAEEVTSNSLQSQEQNQTTSKLDSTDYQFQQKSFRRRVVNRTNNWNGRQGAQQTSNQYPRRRVTVYRGQPRRSPNYASSSRVEANHRRRIIQKRVRLNSEAIDSTIQPDKNTDDVQNITEKYVANSRAENVRRRMKVVMKRVKERVKEEVTTLPTKETTIFLQSSISTDNETLRTYPENGNIGRRRKVILKRIKPQSKKNYATKEISADSTTIDPTITDSTTTNITTSNNTTSNKSLSDNSQSNLQVSEDLLKKEKTRRRMRVILKSVKPISEEKNSTEETSANSDPINKNSQGNFSSNFHVDKNLSDRRNTRRRVVLKSVKLKFKEKNSTIEEASVNLNSTDENLQDNLSNNITTSKNLSDKEQVRRRMRVIVKRVRPKFEERETKIEEASADSNSTNDSSQTTVSSNFRRGKNLPEHGIRRRMRVVLKSVKPKSEEKNSTIEETSVDPDSIDRDLQGSFSSNLHKNLSDEEEARKRMEVVLKNIKPKSEEADSIAEETNAEPDYVNEYPQAIFRLNFSTGLPNQENTMTQSESKERETTTERLEDVELQTAETSVSVEEDTDRPSLEVNSPKNGGSISRKPASRHSNRHRKPTQSTTIAPNTLSSTLTIHRRGRPVETTLSPRIDLDIFEGTESYIKSTAVEDDQKTDVSDQTIHAQEFAVTLADPPTSSPDTGRTVLRDAARRKISTTLPPRTDHTTIRTVRRYGADFRNRQRTRTKDKPIMNVTTRPRRPPVIDYDYYEDDAPIVLGKSALNSKLFLTSKGAVHCLDQGNFPHPYSCKKFITCARMVNGLVIGTEYTCPDKLSFDPVGGICNWSAGLGCKD